MPLFFLILLFAISITASAQQVVVTNHAVPGDPLVQVAGKVLATEIGDSATEVAIVQGGINDIFWWGANGPAYAANAVLQIDAHLKSRFVSAFYQQAGPIIDQVVDAGSYTGTFKPIRPKLEAFNARLEQMSTSHSLTLIRVYAPLSENWVAGPNGWSISDGVHPSAAGCQRIAELWWDAIGPEIMRLHLLHPAQPVRIAIYGDSIPAATYVPPNQRPDAQLTLIANQSLSQSRARDWELYSE